jgi:hypothetical protein
MALLTLPVLAGLTATVIFAASTLPMLVKAYRSRDLASYSLGNIGLANLGNAVNSIYVYSLPPSPIWLLHTFYLVSTALMLGWYLRYGLVKPAHSAAAGMGESPDAAREGGCLASPHLSQTGGGAYEHAVHRDADHRGRAGRAFDRLPPQAPRAPVADR